jgi:hypothetical protein
MASAKANAESARVACAGEVRYHFREELPETAASGKSISAPVTQIEDLPPSSIEIIDGEPVYRVHGRVKHLPFNFDIQLLHFNSATLKIKVTDPSVQKSLIGFPQTIPNANAKLKEGIGVEIPLSPAQKATIEQSEFARKHCADLCEPCSPRRTARRRQSLAI